nr:hypothetical protein [Vibrio vulnificus]
MKMACGKLVYAAFTP